jgi:FlaA1/EpsC-like NDP-sugar epimerase
MQFKDKFDLILGRSKSLFQDDIDKNYEHIKSTIRSARVLVVGAAGSIGQAVASEIFKLQPICLHCVDTSENNLVELTRIIRSEYSQKNIDYISVPIAIGSIEFDAFLNSQPAYTHVFNLSALKHVRTEKDAYGLMRMIDVNIIQSLSLARYCGEVNAKYFCVSTDKAASPANAMGATKRAMELFLKAEATKTKTSLARFANVAFSDGSLLHGFTMRLSKYQPITAPQDVKRYFISPKEAAQLCIMSSVFGDSGDIFFPSPNVSLPLISFEDIALKFIKYSGYEVKTCNDEDEARHAIDKKCYENGQWPCYFFKSDTTGEKPFEEFYTENEELDLLSFNTFGIVKNSENPNITLLNEFEDKIIQLRENGQWTREELISLIKDLVVTFNHIETGRYLDSRM